MEINRQNELSQRPCVIITYDRNKGLYFFKNIGNGPALHVKLDDIPFLEGTEYNFVYKSDSKDLLLPGEEFIVRFINEKGNTASAFFLGAISPLSANNDFTILINYSSIDNVNYTTLGTIGKSGSRFSETKKLNI